MSTDKQQVKCVIWDLDNTVWEGVLSEGGAGALLPGVAKKHLSARTSKWDNILCEEHPMGVR